MFWGGCRDLSRCLKYGIGTANHTGPESKLAKFCGAARQHHGDGAEGGLLATKCFAIYKMGFRRYMM